MYAREVAAGKLTFRFNSSLYLGNLILDDLETGSTWSQLAGAAVRGPLQGTRLRILPSIQTSWRHWRSLHPSTLVVDPHRTMRLVPPYLLQQGKPPVDPQRLAEMGLEMALGIRGQNGAIVYPYRELAKGSQSFEDRLGDRPITIHFVADVPTAWAQNANGKVLPGVSTTLTSWLRFYPRSQLYSASAVESRQDF